MNKRKTLLIGCGKAGNRITNELLEGDKSGQLTGLFVNTSFKDMAELSKRTEENTFLFSSADGSGRDRTIAQQYVKDQVKSLVSVITNYPLHDNIYLITSTDGGSGSGITPMLCQLLRSGFDKKKLLNRKINLIAIMPNQKVDDRLAFENAIGFWNDIVKKRTDKEGNEFSIKDKCLDSIKIIDNTKGKSYNDINAKIVKTIINSFNMNGVSDEGDIDDKDAFKFNTEKGFSIILDIPSGYDSASDAIDKAIKECIYGLPNSYNCEYLGISLNEDDYLIDDIRNCFSTVNKTTYKTYNKLGHNTVVLGGCSEPNELMANIVQKLEEIKNGITNNENYNKDLTVKFENTINKSNKNTKSEVQATFTANELDDLANELDDMF